MFVVSISIHRMTVRVDDGFFPSSLLKLDRNIDSDKGLSLVNSNADFFALRLSDSYKVV